MKICIVNPGRCGSTLLLGYLHNRLPGYSLIYEVIRPTLPDIENVIFKNSNISSREEIVKQILKYLEEEIKVGTKVNQVMRHTVGLYFGQPGSKEWKKYLSDNMMARDSDFQKSKHIMTIVQNNEKANQANT